VDPIRDSAATIARAVNGREASAVDIAETVLAHVERADAALQAFRTLTPELLREQARRVDARVAAGERLPLAGVPARRGWCTAWTAKP
jgi:Asp-tRNA(Asn)/Glu-tRNA(Gln) amidotransferase A subunit family amidase